MLKVPWVMGSREQIWIRIHLAYTFGVLVHSPAVPGNSVEEPGIIESVWLAPWKWSHLPEQAGRMGSV